MRRTSFWALILGATSACLLHCSASNTPASGASRGTSSPGGSSATNGGMSSLGGGGAGGGNGGSAAAGMHSGGGLGGTGGAGAAGQPPGAAGNANGGSGGSAPAPPYKPCPNKATCKIMPLGDSITAGYQSTTGGGYRLRLLHDLWNAKRDATFVGGASSGPDMLDGKPFPKANEGHSAYTIDDAPNVMRSGIAPLTPPALQKYAPQIILLMIGTNDIGTNDDVANAPLRLGNLLDSIIATAPNALLIVAQITPNGDANADELVRKFNAALPALVSSRAAAGKHVALVDMYNAFTSRANYATEYMKDSLHPNDAGYDLMGDTWYAALEPYL